MLWRGVFVHVPTYAFLWNVCCGRILECIALDCYEYNSTLSLNLFARLLAFSIPLVLGSVGFYLLRSAFLFLSISFHAVPRTQHVSSVGRCWWLVALSAHSDDGPGTRPRSWYRNALMKRAVASLEGWRACERMLRHECKWPA